MAKKKVAIIGYGYVGAGMHRMFAPAFDVVIYDPAKYPDKSACLGADLAVICVPTPMGRDGHADTRAVEDSIAWIDAPLILVKSTVPPGTCDLLTQMFSKDVHFSPEFMGEPKNFVPPWRYPDPYYPQHHSWVIVGGARASEILDFFQVVMATDTRYVATTNVAAECVKYMENTYFALKVTFANEWARIAEQFGVDYKHLRELWLLDPRTDPDHTVVFKDNPGFGGKCLPKDLSAIIEASTRMGFRPPLLEAVQNVNNDIQIMRDLRDAAE